MFLRAALLSLLIPALAHAAPVTVTVRGPDGRPLADAVVSLVEPGLPVPAPHGLYVVEQRDVAFRPHVLVVPVGATVSFPNRDKVRHHVYSFSKAKRFDLKLYGREDTRSVTFDKPGAVALGCNIHDQMSGFVFVAATPFAAVTGADGTARFDVPEGRAVLRVWYPSIRGPGNQLEQTAVIAPRGLATAINLAR